MNAMVSQITSTSIVCLTICSGADQRKHESSMPLVIVREIHLWPVDSPHKGPVSGRIFHLMTSSWWNMFMWLDHSCPPRNIHQKLLHNLNQIPKIIINCGSHESRPNSTPIHQHYLRPALSTDSKGLYFQKFCTKGVHVWSRKFPTISSTFCLFVETHVMLWIPSHTHTHI